MAWNKPIDSPVAPQSAMPHTSHLPFRVTDRLLNCGRIAVIASIFAGAAVCAQQNPANGNIYTCTDAAGRRLTSDRPIAECMNREQRVLNRQGWLVKVMAPELTGAERAVQQEKQRQAQQALERQRNQDRGNEALLIRYPDQAAHEASRRAALTQTQVLLGQAKQQLAALEGERAKLASQVAAHPNPANAPAKLKHDIASNAQAIDTQQQLIANYQVQVDRVSAQFDAEDQRLQPLWQNRPIIQ
jgi:chromosome segregation ATPase